MEELVKAVIEAVPPAWWHTVALVVVWSYVGLCVVYGCTWLLVRIDGLDGRVDHPRWRRALDYAAAVIGIAHVVLDAMPVQLPFVRGYARLREFWRTPHPDDLPKE